MILETYENVKGNKFSNISHQFVLISYGPAKAIELIVENKET